MSTIEERIAAALSARTGGITMDTIELQDRFAQVRERGARAHERRRRTVAGVAVLTTAAAAVGAFVLVGGVPGQDEPVPFAAREKAVLGEPSLVSIGTLPDAPTLTVERSRTPSPSRRRRSRTGRGRGATTRVSPARRAATPSSASASTRSRGPAPPRASRS